MARSVEWQDTIIVAIEDRNKVRFWHQLLLVFLSSLMMIAGRRALPDRPHGLSCNVGVLIGDEKEGHKQRYSNAPDQQRFPEVIPLTDRARWIQNVANDKDDGTQHGTHDPMAQFHDLPFPRRRPQIVLLLYVIAQPGVQHGASKVMPTHLDQWQG